MGINTFMLIVPPRSPHQQDHSPPLHTKRSMIRDGLVTFLAWNSLATKSSHEKRIPGQEMPLWKRFYSGSVSVKISERGPVMPFLAAIKCRE